MPTYSFRDKETQETFDRIMSYDAKLKFLEENPHLESIITCGQPVIEAARLGRMKPDQGFSDLLTSMKNNKSYTGNKVNDWK